MRPPAVAGTFYPGNKEELELELRELFGGAPEEIVPRGKRLRAPLGLILPHAGYMYSGGVAAEGFVAAAAEGKPEAVIIFATNHTGYGGAITLGEPEAWVTPLGEVPVEDDLLKKLEKLPGTVRDRRAFIREHSVEVQLPFIQYLFGAVPFVPAVVYTQNATLIREFSRGLSEIVKGKPVWIIASSDFSHYEPQDVAVEKDRAALEE
ncbi:TPA: AmmeMemoRadiSam system protein B, partial [Candidatus Micrarchaeota archaeon]|nr:AmmeMemoRadiSam system protein B [Candidatus Micrarchaeota archaeon]